MTIKEPFMFLPEIIQFELPRILKLSLHGADSVQWCCAWMYFYYQSSQHRYGI